MSGLGSPWTTVKVKGVGKAVKMLEALTTRVGAIEEKVDGIMSSAEQISANLTNISGDIDGLQASIAALQGTNTTLQAAVDGLPAEVASQVQAAQDAQNQALQAVVDQSAALAARIPDAPAPAPAPADPNQPV
jgi:ABC-type transporter Mla subunit MlaD